MKTNLTLKFAFAAVALFASLAAIQSTHAQTVTWNRQALGQAKTDPCGNPFNWPNDNSWDIQEIDSTACGQSYVLQPSNWSTATFPNGSNLDVIVGAPAPISLDIAVTLHSLTVQSGAGNINMTAASSFNVQNYDFQTDGIFTTSLNHGHGGGTPVINVAGTFKKSAGAGVLDISGGNSGNAIYFDMLGGTVQVTSGTLMLSRGESTGATFTVAANAVVDITNGSIFDDWSGTYGGSGAGAVQLNNGLLHILSPGATFNFSGGLFQWNGGTISTAATLTNTGTMTLAGSAAKEIDGTLFHNAGTMIQTGTGNLQFSGMMTNDANGTYDIRSDAGMGSNGEIDNYGTFKKSAGTGTSSIFAPGGSPDNFNFSLRGGTVECDSGTLQLGRNYPNTSGATFIVAAGAVVDLNTSGIFSEYAGTYTGTGGGAVQINGGQIQSATPGATFNFSGNLFQWNGGTIVAGQPFTNTGTMTLAGPGTKQISGTLFHNAGTMIQTGTGNLQPSFMTNDANGTYDIRSDAAILGGQFENFGTFKKSAGTGTSSMSVNGSPDNTIFDILGGTVEVDSGTLMLGRSLASTGGTLIVAAGAVLDLNSAGIFGQYAGTYNGTGAGTLRMTGGQIGINGSGATFNFQGNLFQWSGGNINLGAPLDNQGTITIAGNVGINGSGFVNHGIIKGNGSISGSITNNGTVSPGLSPGKLTINGSYTQGSTGILNLEIGGSTPVTEYDQFAVSGSAALDGSLNLTLINGYRPKVGDVFQVISFGSFTGQFATINFTGFTATVTYAASGITIKVLTVPDIPLNIATRLLVNPDPNELIGGFIITGTEPKKVIIRGIGPSLSSFFSGVLADPTIQLFQGNTMLVSNDNWKVRDSDGSSQQAEIEATTIPPSNDLESAIVATLAPGTYTAVLRGKGGTSGIGVIEAYDLDQNAKSKLANIATRGLVGTNENVMIGGFIVGGNGQAESKVVIRAIGPSLAAFGIANVLADPVLELHDANGTNIQSNDDWQDTQAAAISQTGLAPTDPHESAIVTTLPDGAYTAIVRGKSNTTGVAVVEVYNVL